jgi:hypothetical protein
MRDIHPCLELEFKPAILVKVAHTSDCAVIVTGAINNSNNRHKGEKKYYKERKNREGEKFK